MCIFGASYAQTHIEMLYASLAAVLLIPFELLFISYGIQELFSYGSSLDTYTP